MLFSDLENMDRVTLTLTGKQAAMLIDLMYLSPSALSAIRDNDRTRMLQGLAEHIPGMIEDAVKSSKQKPTLAISDAMIARAYELYDSDSRVNGPEDYEAFSEAVRKGLNA